MDTGTWVLTIVIVVAIGVDVWTYFKMRDEVAELREDVEAMTRERPSAIGFMVTDRED